MQGAPLLGVKFISLWTVVKRNFKNALVKKLDYESVKTCFSSGVLGISGLIMWNLLMKLSTQSQWGSFFKKD